MPTSRVRRGVAPSPVGARLLPTEATKVVVFPDAPGGAVAASGGAW